MIDFVQIRVTYSDRTILYPFRLDDTFGFIQYSLHRLFRIDYQNDWIKWVKCIFNGNIESNTYTLGVDVTFDDVLLSIYPNYYNRENLVNPINIDLIIDHTPCVDMMELNLSNYCNSQYEGYIWRSIMNSGNFFLENQPITYLRNHLNQQNYEMYNYSTAFWNHLRQLQQQQQEPTMNQNTQIVEDEDEDEYIEDSEDQEDQEDREENQIEEEIVPVIEFTFIMGQNRNQTEDENPQPENDVEHISPMNQFQQNLIHLLGLDNLLQPNYHDVHVVMSEEDFDQLPNFTYREWKEQNQQSEYQPTECTICLEKYSTDSQDLMVKLPQCVHIYHKECIRPWLIENSYKCPVCRETQGAGNPLY